MLKGGEKMNNKIILIVVALVVVLVGAFLLLNNNANKSANTQKTNSLPTQAQQAVKEANVTVTSKGFEPENITIKAGQRVVWTNKSGEQVTVNSDLHPTHLLWPFLNLGNFDDGSSVSVVFEKPGVYTYHNHLNPSQTGIVTVE